MPTSDSVVKALRSRVSELSPDILAELTALVAIPSVSADSFDQAEVERSAEHVARAFAGLGLDVQVLRAESDHGLGRPAVLAHAQGPADAPRVLLYAHHDVQPPGESALWSQEDPFSVVERDGRLYGRGVCDDGAGVITHLTALRALRDITDGNWPVSVTVFIEGEEEVGSPSFRSFLATYRERLASDVIIVADSANWKVGVPALTTSLRGVVQADVRLDVLDHALHSGQYSGPIIDAVTLMCRLIASCHDERGDLVIAGLIEKSQAGVSYTEDELRADSGLLDGVELAGTGDIAARLWTKPTLTVIGMDVTSLDRSSNTLAPSCTARLSLRIAPGQDPQAAFDALRDHLEAHAPFSSHVTVTLREAGPSFDGSSQTPAGRIAHWALAEAWGTQPVDTGQGGSIPFISDFAEFFPTSQVLVTGMADPDTRAHGIDESIDRRELERAVLAEALVLARLGDVVDIDSGAK